MGRIFLTRAFVIAAVIAALGVSGCGRKGPLDAPGAAVAPATDAQPADDKASSDAKPDTKFILDPLLK